MHCRTTGIVTVRSIVQTCYLIAVLAEKPHSEFEGIGISVCKSMQENNILDLGMNYMPLHVQQQLLDAISKAKASGRIYLRLCYQETS